MEITNLKLTNFRNFRDLELNFPSEGCLIFGKNGLGKTNIFEAISYFTFGKSTRSNQDSDLINFSQNFFRLVADFLVNKKKLHFEIAVDKNRKIIKLNDENISRLSELYKYTKIVTFSPKDILIIDGSPQKRRFFFDQAISQYSYEYITILREYQRILKQRNALLKQTHFSKKEKSVWDKKFIELNEKIIDQRINYLHKFVPKTVEQYGRISGESEELNVVYHYSFPNFIDKSLSENLSNYIRDIEDREIAAQRSLVGIHLDDYEFSLNGKNARRFASQGQKRTMVITAGFSEAILIAEKNREFPILLFDDVLSDLDHIRVKKVIELLSDKHQVFIATPNVGIYQDFHLSKLALADIV